MEANTGFEIRLHGDQGIVNGVAFSPDGSEVLTGSFVGVAQLWNVENGQLIRTLKGQSLAVVRIDVSADGQRFMIESADGKARIWDAASGKQLNLLPGFPVWGNSVLMSADGSQIVTGSTSDSNWVSVWDVKTGQLLRHLSDVPGNAVALSVKNGFFLTAGSPIDNPAIRDLRTGRILHELGVQQKTQAVQAVIQPLDEPHGQSITLALNNPTNWSSSAVLSPDAECVLTGGYNGIAKLWDVRTGQEIREFKGHSNQVSSTAFSPDGRQVLTGSWDKKAKLWEVASGREVRTFNAPSEITSVAFSPNGREIFASTFDGTARVWDSKTGRELHILIGDTGPGYPALFFCEVENLPCPGAPTEQQGLWT